MQPLSEPAETPEDEKKKQTKKLRKYFFAATFLGSGSGILIFYALVSPYWFVLNSRDMTHQATRVLGLVYFLEARDEAKLSHLWSAGSFAERARHSIAVRRRTMCQAAGDDTDKGPTETLVNETVDLEDVSVLEGISIPCKRNPTRAWGAIPIPIPPAPRIMSSLRYNGEDVAKHDYDYEKLLWGCKTKPEKGNWLAGKCPVGYKRCPTKNRCPDSQGKKGRGERCCMIDRKVVGRTLYNVTLAPTYAHVYGYAQWHVRDLWNEPAKEENWCSLAEIRCEMWKTFEKDGWRCCCFLMFSLVLILLATLCSSWSLREKTPILMFICFSVAVVVATYGISNYTLQFRGTLEQHMTKKDEWGRPYVHAMTGYNQKAGFIKSMFGKKNGRSILDGWKKRFPDSAAEWIYYYLNKRIDITHVNQRAPEGFHKLWGHFLGLVGCGAGGFAALISLEILLIAHCKVDPLTRAALMLVFVLVYPLKKAKDCVDNNIAAYPVMHIYPWQKLYPTAFTAGSWLVWPLDELWDCCLMMPVHLTRALWDYVSCQDICSPAEKAKLRSRGIENDRLQSLLCSRRSYFVLMATLGIVNFMVQFRTMMYIADLQTHFQQAANLEDAYPWFYCSETAGNCPVEYPDLKTLKTYLSAMAIRFFGVVRVGANQSETIQAVIEWFGSFLSVCCALAALIFWTHFSYSRKFCVLGWICMMLTPAVTSAFSPNTMVDWDEVDRSVVTTAVEVWQDVILFANTKPCEQLVDHINFAQGQVDKVCGWVRTLSFAMPKNIQNGCKMYYKVYGKTTQQMVIGNLTAFCSAAEQIVLDGPKTRQEAEAHVKEYVPMIQTIVRVLVGLKSGVGNMQRIIPAVISMIPALMQGGLMVKNLVPRQSTPSILTTLPWAYTLVVWVQYQLYYQFMNDTVFLIACVLMSFGPMLYWIFGKYYSVHQPMDDQQSVTVTFRIWYYALICALIIPYVLMIIYITWVNTFLPDLIFEQTIGWILRPTAGQVLQLLSGTLMNYSYTLQAGIDWFVDELVSHHLGQHAPLAIAASRSAEEARAWQQMLGTSIDIDAIESGTYVCGGLSDPERLYPPEEGSWSHKAQTYSISLAQKDFATLDAFASHFKHNRELPQILAYSRRPWYRWMPWERQHEYVHSAFADFPGTNPGGFQNSTSSGWVPMGPSSTSRQYDPHNYQSLYGYNFVSLNSPKYTIAQALSHSSSQAHSVPSSSRRVHFGHAPTDYSSGYEFGHTPTPPTSGNYNFGHTRTDFSRQDSTPYSMGSAPSYPYGRQNSAPNTPGSRGRAPTWGVDQVELSTYRR